MGSLFESGMLICFGFSWPLNVIKAYKARSAKGTSLAFILLIITGYICGITAKFVNHQINYVLIVYFLNLAIVMLNLMVYFRNKKLDSMEEPMDRREKDSNCVVLFGSDEDKIIPVAEIAQDYEFNFKMFNRSGSGINLKNAEEYFEKQIEPLNPEAVIIHIGKNDYESFKSNSAEFDIKYINLLHRIKQNNSEKRIALVSNNDFNGEINYNEMNRHIKAIADSEDCTFIDIANAKLWAPESTKELMSFMYSVGFDQQLKVKKPLGDIVKIIYSYAYQNGIITYKESAAI